MTSLTLPGMDVVNSISHRLTGSSSRASRISSMWVIRQANNQSTYTCLKLFDGLIKKYSKASSLEIADIYKAFEELEVLLDKARNDPNLDKVVWLGANRSLFILGKYYAKLDDCEVYAIATSMYLYSSWYQFSFCVHLYPVVLTPTLRYRWFKRNPGWLKEWKDLPLKKIQERWAVDYKPKPLAPPKTFSAPFPPESPATSSNVCMLALSLHHLFPFLPADL